MTESEWEVLDLGGDDETRQSATGLISFGSLYEVVKLAYLKPSSAVKERVVPRAVCSAAHGMVCVTLDCALLLFAESCSTLVLQLLLPHPVETVLWLGSPNFLIATDRSGQLHFIHVPSRRLLITRQLTPEGDADNCASTLLSAHCQLLTEGCCSLLFVAASGLLIRVNNVHLERIDDGLSRGCVAELVEAERQLSFDYTQLTGRPLVCAGGVVGACEAQVLVWGATRDGDVLLLLPHLLLEKEEDGSPAAGGAAEEVLVKLPFVCSKLLPVASGRYLLALSEEGTMAVVCTCTGVTRLCGPPGTPQGAAATSPPGRVLDAVLLPWTDSSAQPQLLALVEPAPQAPACLLRVLALPGLECEYELSVLRGSSLVPLAEGVEAMIFLEPELSTHALKIKTIVDGVPETRLRKLISKQKFEEALQFAALFSLDASLVAKGRARLLLQQLNPYRPAPAASFIDCGSLLEQVLSVLDTIDDCAFVGSVCVEAVLPDVRSTEALLSYAAKRLADPKSEKYEGTSALRDQVGRLQHRLGTFLRLQPTNTDPAMWAAFVAADPLDLCVQHLSTGALSMSSCIWQRHQHEFSSRVDEECVERVLQSVPASLPSHALVCWLPHSVADLLALCPRALPLLVDWVLVRVRRLECREKQLWPDNGLRVGNTVMAAIERGMGSAACGSAVCPDAAVKQLRHMLQALQQLQTLLRDYRLRVPLQQYMQREVAQVCSSVLQWLVCGEEVQQLVQRFLVPVLCGGDRAAADAVLQQYVQHELDQVQQQQWLLGEQHEAHWEDKLHAVTRSISSQQVRVRCMVLCVERASVPWSGGTEALCDEALQAVQAGAAAGHRCSLQLLELRSLARLKVTLGRHGLRIGELGDFRTAQVVLRKLARSKQEGVLEAMLQVVATFHHLQPSQAYQHRIYHLLHQGDYTTARSTLQGVPQQHVQDTCCRLLHDILQTLHHAPLCKQMREVRERVAEGAVSLQQLLLQHAPSRDRSQWRTDLNAVAALSRLQLEYGEHPSWRSLHDPRHCRHLLQLHVARWFESRKSSDPEAADPSCPIRAPALRDITALATNTSDAAGRQLGERNTSGPKRKLNTAAEQENVTPGAVVEVQACGEEKTSTRADPQREGQWGEVARLLELGSLLGLSRVAVLRLVAAAALQQEDVEPALWAVGLLAEDPLTTTASDCRGDTSSDLTALVHKLQQLLLLQLETLCRPKTDTEEGDCFSIVSDAPAAVEGGHAATARLLHHTLRIVSAALLQAPPEWLRWLCSVAVWGSAGSMLYERCHKTEAYGTDAAAQSDAINSFTPLYWDRGMPLVARQVSGALLEAVRWCLATYDSTLAAMSSSSSYNQPPNGALGSLVESVSSLTSHALQRNSDLTALLMHTKVTSLVKIDANNSLGGNNTDSCKGPPQLSQLLNSQLVFSLLLKLIQPSRTDGQLAVSILSLLPLREALSILNELIKRFGFDYSRLEAVSELGVSLCGMHKQVDIRVKFEDLGKNARWGKRFAEMSISFKDYFGKAVAILQKLFDVIVQHPNCTCSLLKDFCVDFNLSFTDAMLCYLCHLVRKGMPEVQEDGSLRSTDAFSIEQLAQVSARVDDRVLLRKTLLFELQQAHSYHYDTIYFLLRELCAMDEPEGTNQVWQRGLDILHFLRGYKRKAKPHNVELDEWLQKNPSLNSLPSVATQRLPFSELFQGTAKLVMKIIDGELDVLTIDSWLRCSDSLKLNQDEMCFVAVQNTVSRSLDRRVRQDAAKGQSWELTACHSDLLKDVSSVILKIKHDKLAMACGKSVVQLLPPGADRVQCTRSCLLMAQRWHSHCESEESREAVAKFASEYERLLVEQALHHHTLALPKYLKLVGDPVALVKTLYHHPSLASFSGPNSDSMPRVNECVTEICQAIKCNQSLVQKELLDQWLPPPDAGLGSGGDDVTISNFTISLLSTAGSAVSTADSEQDTLARAMYLVRGCCADTIIPYLLERVESSSSVVSAAHRLRALHCLTALADSPLMDTYVAPHTLQTYLEQLTLAVRLESLGIVCEPEQLDDMDKSALTEQLWRDHRHSPTALLLIADICLRYKVLKAPLWNAVLQQLAVCEEGDAVQESALRSLLLRLRLHPQLWLLQGFVASWTALVSQPFKNVSQPLSPAAVARCTSAASLLSQCPVALPAVRQLVPAAVQLRLFAVAICVAAALPETRHLMQEVWDATPAAELKEQFTCLRSEMALPRLVEALLETNGMSLQ